jgi:hypothetical protein
MARTFTRRMKVSQTIPLRCFETWPVIDGRGRLAETWTIINIEEHKNTKLMTVRIEEHRPI